MSFVSRSLPCSRSICHNKLPWNNSVFTCLTCVMIKFRIHFAVPIRTECIAGKFPSITQPQRQSERRWPNESMLAGWQGPVLSACCLPMLVSCLPCCSILKTDAISSLVTQADFHRATWCYISEGGALHYHHYENLRFQTKLGLQWQAVREECHETQPVVSYNTDVRFYNRGRSGVVPRLSYVENT
jgi:hypothetical protein